MQHLYLTAAIFLFFVHFLQGQTAILTGTLTDAETREVLIGATVEVEGTGLGALTDVDGRYRIEGVKPGRYTVKASYVGYTTRLQYEVRIETGTNTLNLSLMPEGIQVEGVEITASSFTKTTANIVSTRTLGNEQILSYPGGNNDISRVVQSLPGVGGSVGFRNDLIIRGGAPNENVFFLDGIEIPNLNHFATQGSGGGPVGILNAIFIENVSFQSSGFDARFDNTLSSVFDFEFKSGNTERFQTLLTVGASEAGVTFDTPLGNKTTLLASARRSYLQFLFEAINLPFLPDFWDFQAKLQHKLSPKTTLTYIGIGAIDRFTLNDAANVSVEQRYLLDGLPIQEQDTYTHGVSTKTLTKNGFVQIALSRNWLQNRIYKHPANDESQPRILDIRSTEAENKLRVNVVSRQGAWTLGYGAIAQIAEFRDRTFTIRQAAAADAPQAFESQAELTFLRYGAYASLSRNALRDRLKLRAGLRLDGNSFTTTGHELWRTLSPRISASYELAARWTLNASVGRYFKLPPYTLLGFSPDGQRVNQDAAYIRTDHYVLGTEYLIDPSWTVAAEGFFKDYANYPVSLANGLSLANLGGGFGVFGNEATRSVGQGRAYGLELYTQKRLTKSFYGIASYTLYWSEFSGLPDGLAGGDFVRSAWDNRHLVALTAGILFGKTKSWELAARWRFQGPAPYTPWRTDSAALVFYELRGEGLPDFAQLNRAQTNVFSQLDLRLDKKWFFKRWSLNVFLDIQNALNTFNESIPAFTLLRDPANPDAFQQPLTPALIRTDQTSLLPSFGLRIKF